MPNVSPDLDKFEGTWQRVSGNDTMIIRLKKSTRNSTITARMRSLACRYVRNGVVIENALQRFDSLAGDKKKRTILLSYITGANTAKVKGTIKDLTKKKTNLVTLQYVSGSPATIIWHLELAEGSYHNPDFQYGLTMPKEIILTRQ